MMGPANAMNRGQRSPSSKEITVPGDRADREEDRGALRPAPRELEVDRRAGPAPAPLREDHEAAASPTPTAANTMWNTSERPKSQRAARRSDTDAPYVGPGSAA